MPEFTSLSCFVTRLSQTPMRDFWYSTITLPSWASINWEQDTRILVPDSDRDIQAGNIGVEA